MVEEIKTDENKQLDIFGELEKEIHEELLKEKKITNETFKKDVAKQRNFFAKVFETMFGKLLTKLQIKIVVSWNGNELFTYVIPKN